MCESGETLEMKKFVAILALVLIILSSGVYAWPICYKPVFKGKVIDSETYQPIEGAVVFIQYRKETYLAGVDTFHVKETLTDKNGIFRISSYITLFGPLSRSFDIIINVYKPGYGYPRFGNLDRSVRFDTAIEEEFFSKDFGKQKVVWFEPAKRTIGTVPRYKYVITYGLIGLPRLETIEERKKISVSLPINFENKMPLLKRLIDEEHFLLYEQTPNNLGPRMFRPLGVGDNTSGGRNTDHQIPVPPRATGKSTLEKK